MKKNLTNILIASNNTLELLGLKYLLNDILTTVAVTEASSTSELYTYLNAHSFDYLFLSEAFYEEENEKIHNTLQPFNKLNWFIIGQHGDANDITLEAAATEQEIVKFIRDKVRSKQKESTIQENSLSDREQEILKLVALGKTNKEISEQLYISLHTVITHRKNITSKLDIKTIPGLTIYAILNKIIDANEVNF